MTVESPIFTRKLKILPKVPKVPTESESNAWTANEKTNKENSTENILNASGYYELETFLPTNENRSKSNRLNHVVVKTSVNDVKVRQICTDGFGGISVYKKFNDRSVNKNSKSFHLSECCPWTTPWILLTNSMVQVRYIITMIIHFFKRSTIYICNISMIDNERTWLFRLYI